MLVLFKNIPSIIASQAGTRFSANVSWNLLLSRLSDLTKESERGRHIGYFSAAFAFAYALGNLAGGWLYSAYGADGVFLCTSWIALAAALLIYFTFSDLQPKKEKRQISFSMLKTQNGIANASISFFTGTQSITYGYAIYLFFASEYSFSPEQIGTLVGFLFGIWAVSTFLLGRVSDRFGTVRT
jgi:predicted MFS family arabinose efflux permease